MNVLSAYAYEVSISYFFIKWNIILEKILVFDKIIKNKEKIARACVRFCNFFTKLSFASSLVGMTFSRMS